MSSHTEGFYRHGLARMTGRDVAEHQRVASPLELLFDLVFAAAFGVLGIQFAHGVAADHLGGALAGFLFGGTAIVWAWINYSWFASAFDTDDWLFRLLTMLQMAGVIVLAIGLPEMFASVEAGEPLANEVMVAGYIVMRVAMVCQWLRAARAPEYRALALTYASLIVVAQIGWSIVAWLPMDLRTTLVAAAMCWAVELAAPILAERKGIAKGGGTSPWHPHHIAERYALLTIIVLGETVIGTIDAAQVITEHEGWSAASITVIAAGIALTFALWWTYFLVPSAPVLVAHRERAFVWGYGHAFVFLSIAAVGASLHMIGYLFDEHYHLSPTVVIACIAGAVVAFSVSLYLIDTWLVREFNKNLLVQVPALGLPLIAIALSAGGSPFWLCLLVILAGPVVVVISYEVGGWRAIDAQLRRAVGETSTAGA